MDNPSVRQIILELENQIFDAIQRKDLGALSPLLADDFAHRSSDGAEIGKQEFLKNIGAMPVQVMAIRGEHQKVSVFGNIAVLTGVQHANWRKDDAEGIHSAAFTDVFQLRGDAWLLVLAHSMELSA